MNELIEKQSLNYKTTPNSKATVIFSHAFVENSSYYTSLEKPFLDAGIDIVRYTLKGHNQKIIENIKMSDYLKDLDIIVDYINQQDSSKPIFLLGFSLGSLITLNWLLLNPYKVMGAIVIGAPLFINNTFNNLKKPLYSIEEFLDILETTGDEGIQALLKFKTADYVTKDFLQNIFYDSIQFVLDNKHNFFQNILLIHGEFDPISSIKPVIDFSNETSNEIIVFENQYHDLLRIKDKKKTTDTIINWINSQL